MKKGKPGGVSDPTCGSVRAARNLRRLTERVERNTMRGTQGYCTGYHSEGREEKPICA